MPYLETSADTAYYNQLPTVSFRVITDDPSLSAPAGVHSTRHYGYNDFSDFTRPEHYIRHIEPIESELAVQVEYDMDEQDQAWLDAINAERKKEQAGNITYEVFEIIMDKLEKEWFNLVKRIPQPASHMPVEDSKCAVCDDGEGENSNAIVFCDGCNLAVHQDCYGVPYIPEGQWLCRKCTVSPENPVSCLVCPNEGGAFKQTTSGHWAHLLCAIWIPELMVGNAIYMEPIDGVQAIPKNRWKLTCSLCRERVGACIQCDNRNCFTAFHVTCARQVGFLMSMKSIHNEGSLKAFCEKHLPDALQKDTFDDEFDSNYSGTPPPPRQNRRTSHNGTAQAVTTKTARAHAKSYRPGPPIVPHIIVKSLSDYVTKINIRKRAGFVERLCRYWSLKREARRGAPLLKRLHLEPWTASNAGRQQTEAEKALKLTFLKMLRNDLEKVRMLAEQVRKREREKLRQAQVIKDVVDGFIFPGYEQLRLTLEKVSAMDRQELFLHPVNRMEVPDYFEVIKEPMSWLQMDEKVEKNVYRNVSDFKSDIHLVLDNATLYNKAETAFHKTAKRIKINVQPLLDNLDQIAAISTLVPPDEELDLTPAARSVGDLEPSLVLLASLLKSSALDPEQDNLTSLFSFQLEKARPPTPPPPSPPKKPIRKHVTAEEKRRRWEERDAAAKERAAARATRATITANTDFAREAGYLPSDTEAHSRQISGASRSSRKSGRSQLSSVLTEQSSDTVQAGETGPSEPRSRNRSQRGVAGLETVAILSDRERREQEKALDLVTEQVDEKDQFKRFNVGWVLPEGSKRRRAESTLTVPRNGSARLSTSSPLVTTATIPETTATYAPSSPLTSASTLTPPSSEAEEPEPIEEDPPVPAAQVDTPHTTRKRKAPDYPPTFGRSKRKKPNAEHHHVAEVAKEAQAEQAEDEEGEEEIELLDEVEVEPAPARTTKGKGKESKKKGTPKVKADVPEESIVAEESDLAQAEDTTVVEEPIAEQTSEPVRNDQNQGEEDLFPPGTLVWAKIPSFPYFPAEIIDHTGEESWIPQTVLNIQPEDESKRYWLVRFYDTQRSFAWVDQTKLDGLGDSDSLDSMYLAGKERKRVKGFKTPRQKLDVRKAYRQAMDAIAQSEEEV